MIDECSTPHVSRHTFVETRSRFLRATIEINSSEVEPSTLIGLYRKNHGIEFYLILAKGKEMKNLDFAILEDYGISHQMQRIETTGSNYYSNMYPSCRQRCGHLLQWVYN